MTRAQLEIAADRAAAEARIDPKLLRAIAQAESSWNPRAVSPVGAKGIVQIMPKTWAELRGRYGGPDDPFDPVQNLRLGAHYLREIATYLNSQGVPVTIRRVAAAYNGGMGMVTKRYRENRDEVGWPLESRNYAAKVARLVGSLGGTLSLGAVAAAAFLFLFVIPRL
ncbi:MAG: lytic transglycosylase domain-containing protein [Hyphomicrobiaceae bacterium]|nr:MAG: lytic transglycosylase domain-containing protein [Hyphomicrobiaceae bacterium]